MGAVRLTPLPPRTAVVALVGVLPGSSASAAAKPAARAQRRAAGVAARAQSDASDKVQELITTAQDTWEQTENKTTVASAAGITFILIVLADAVLTRLNGFPLLPSLLELVGIGYSGYFIYRYALFKPDREELVNKIKSYRSKIGLE